MLEIKILLVEPDPQVLEIVMSSLVRRFDAHVTCVADAESCLNVEMVDPHDIVICEMDLEGADGQDQPDVATAHPTGGLALTRDLRALSNRPVILLADDPSCDDAVEALRIGAADLFPKPFAVEELMDAVERQVYAHELKRQHAQRYHRMRDLVRRVMKERRQLNRRVELICRDLVGAHQRLVHRVVESERVTN